jgi:hypothetical protein
MMDMNPLGRALAVITLAAGAARGATVGVDAIGFDAPIDPFAYITVQGAKALDPGGFHLAGYGIWNHRPFRLAGGVEGIEDAYIYNLVAGVGIVSIGKRAGLEAGLSLPLVLAERGFDLDRGEPIHDEGVGDLRADVKLAVLDRDDDVVGLAFRAWGRFPTGHTTAFASNDAVQVGVDAELEYHAGFFRTGLNLGYQWLDGTASTADVTIDDSVRLGYGLGIAPLSDIRGWEPLEVVFELTHSFRASRPYARQEESPLMVGGALRWAGTLFALVGGSAALTRGAGAPDAQLVAALGVTF